MIGNLFGPSGASEILKTVFKTSPVGAASGAISEIFKSAGIMDDIGKLLDGLVDKPKPGGFGGIGKTLKKITDQLQQQKGLPTGLLPAEWYDGQGGKAGGQGSQWSPAPPKPGYGSGASGVGASLAGMAQKAMFIATLQRAIQDAASKQHFNMETAINDLWIKLGGLRPQGRQDLQQLNQMFQTLEGIMQRMHEVQKGAIGNLR